jgi:hypothetical protein
MTSAIKSVRASHFKNIYFISMALNTIVNLVVITSVSYAYLYSGLLFSVVFFFGLIGLSRSKLGVHPSLNAKVFLLCLIPEFLNLLTLDHGNLALIALAGAAVGLAITPSVNSGAIRWLSLLGFGALTMAKLTELGTRFEDLLFQSAGFLALIGLSALVIMNVFSEQRVRKTEIKDELIDLDEYQNNLKFWLDPNFKYRLNLEDGDFLTKRLLEPLEASYPFLRKNAHKGLSERYPLMQIITKESVPYLKASNIQISASEEEKAKLYSKLQSLDYTWFTNMHDSSSFAIAPLSMQSDLSLNSFEPIAFETIVTQTETAPMVLESLPAESKMNEQITGEGILQEDKDILEDSSTEKTIARESENNKPKLVDVEFRAKRIFTPNSGRPLTKLRKIDPEGGSQDFQWNVPSK